MTPRRATATTPRRFPAVVLAGALTLLVVSVVWTIAKAGDRSWSRSSSGSGMMGYVSRGSGERVRDIQQAKREAQRFADRFDLRTGEVIEFERNFYAVLLRSDGDKATEVLVDPDSGDVTLEYGPAMMWNTRYGMMGGHMGGANGMMGGAMGATGMMGGAQGDGGATGGGMMGGRSRGTAAEPRSSRYSTGERALPAEEAERVANSWLRRNRTGLRAGEAERFPGYYTLETFRGDRVAGMMSVNEYTGSVWYHSWHGRFRSMID